jgi:guanidinobutyrase
MKNPFAGIRPRLWLFTLCAALCFGYGMASAADKKEEPPEVPAWLEEKIANLPKEKREFLLSEDAMGFAGTWPKLFHKLRERSPEEIEAFVDGMISVMDAYKFNPETDMAAIPLNTESEEFNAWKTMRPKELSPKREPGPIELSYYTDSRYGIATFAGAPVAIYPEDLEAGNVDVAIVGAPLDMGSYYRGARFGPQAMRAEYGAAGPDMYTMVNPSKDLTTRHKQPGAGKKAEKAGDNETLDPLYGTGRAQSRSD